MLLAIYGADLGLASAQLTGTILVDIPPAESRQGSATQSGFADATRWSLFVAAAFLTAGLVTATQLQPAKRPGG